MINYITSLIVTVHCACLRLKYATARLVYATAQLIRERNMRDCFPNITWSEKSRIKISKISADVISKLLFIRWLDLSQIFIVTRSYVFSILHIIIKNINKTILKTFLNKLNKQIVCYETKASRCQKKESIIAPSAPPSSKMEKFKKGFRHLFYCFIVFGHDRSSNSRCAFSSRFECFLGRVGYLFLFLSTICDVIII